MYKAKALCFLPALLIVSIKPLQSQHINQLLTNGEKYAVIKSSSQILKDNYLFPNKAKEIESILSEKFKAGFFAKVVDPKAFGKELQALMQGVTRDKHLRIIYSPTLVKNLEGIKNEQDSLELYKQDFAARKKINFGLPEAKVWQIILVI